MAETLLIPPTKDFPIFGPSSNNVVESPSEGVPEEVMTLTANRVSIGLPLARSIICPADSDPSKETAVCSDVETLWSLRIT